MYIRFWASDLRRNFTFLSHFPNENKAILQEADGPHHSPNNNSPNIFSFIESFKNLKKEAEWNLFCIKNFEVKQWAPIVTG